MKRIKSFFKILGMLVLCASFTGCGVNGNIDDYAVIRAMVLLIR